MSSSLTRESAFRLARDESPVVTGGTDRAQASPVAALVALFAVCAGVSLYATVLGGSIPAVGGGTVAEPALDRAYDVVTAGGVADPERLSAAAARGPAGRRLNVTLSAADAAWSVGPDHPPDARDRASRLVSVRLAPGRVEPGRLTVVVWS